MTSRAQSPAALSDEEVVRRFQETRDGAWFGELFKRYRKKVYFACKRFFPDSGAAEDATQETFLRVYGKIQQFSGGDFGAWLMRIAKNICIDQWRKDQCQAQVMQSEIGDGGAVEGTVDALACDLHHAAERVCQEMKMLPREQRRCLEMKIEGYSYEETASRMGLTIEAVKSHLQNGRRMLWMRMEGRLARSR
jgi:RNA polymerase sigma-70 factor (ECF subfamily)